MARVCKAFVAIVVFWRVFVVTKAGDDAKATLANRSNDSNLDSVSKEFNSYRPSDMTAKAAASQMPPLTALMSPSLPSPQYLPAIQQNLPPPVNIYTTTPAPPPVQSLSHFRSENMPYGFDYFALPYPVANPITHPMAQRNPEPIIAVSPKYIVLLSFIGLLLLFAIIQNTIVATKRKGILVDNLNNRRKRELYDTIGLEDKFSMLTPEAKEVLNDDGKIRCIQRTICLENRKLVRDLGKIGKILGKYLTRDIVNSLVPTSGWGHLVEDAAAAGLRNEDCSILYRDCSSFKSIDSEESLEHPKSKKKKKKQPIKVNKN